MTKRRGRVQREKGLPDLSITPRDDPIQLLPGEEPDDEISWITDAGDHRFFERFTRTNHGRLLDFCVRLEIKTAAGWSEIIRFECSHEKPHGHRTTRAGEERALDLSYPDDLDEAYAEARNVVYNETAQHLQRWRDERI